jgi:transketolase
MGGIANGIAYHGGFIPYDATFLTFSDYMRGAVRLSALAGLHVVDVWTHDSVGLGEDGPTHQPVEHYAALRAIPNLWFVRPGDANETSAAWALAIERRDGPVALALTRQKLPVLAGTAEAARDGVRRGGYVLREAAGGTPVLILIATGSELQLAMAAATTLEGEGIATRVVSLPCWERFELQDAEYRDSVLPPTVRARVSVEIGVSLGWERWVGDGGAIIGLDHFGASAPAGTIFEHLGFTAARVAEVGRGVVRDGLRGRIPTIDGGHFGTGSGPLGSDAGHLGSGPGHPTVGAGEAGVDRTGGSDPGHS